MVFNEIMIASFSSRAPFGGGLPLCHRVFNEVCKELADRPAVLRSHRPNYLCDFRLWPKIQKRFRHRVLRLFSGASLSYE
jgi:hypothetical protein